MKYLFKRTAVIALGAYLAAGAWMFVFQRDYIYFPDQQDFAACPGFEKSEKLDLSGTRAYFQPGKDKVVVFYHGNAGSACDRWFLKEEFARLGYGFLFVEYAGYSGDSRQPTQKLLMQDVENVAGFLAGRNYGEVVVAGESLGASLALYHSTLAAEDKLLLIAPFYRIAEVAQKHYPIFPVSLLLRDKYETKEWLSDIKKVMIIHGASDEIIPPAQAERLHEAIASADKKLVFVPDSGHNDIYDFKETYETIKLFLKE